jgi:alpha-D-ribose 1-methylphosphonate 5-triphosphate diphosphatase
MPDSSTLLTHATVIAADRLLPDHDITLMDGTIATIKPHQSDAETEQSFDHIYDLDGAYLMPGMIDIHSDAIESILQPRPTSVMSLDIAFLEHEKQLLNQGITTMYHSLTLTENGGVRNKEARKPKQMQAIVDRIAEHNRKRHLIRHKFHCRFDMRYAEGVETLFNYIENDRIHLLSFNDHTPGQGQYRDLPQYKEIMMKYLPGSTEEQITKMVDEKMAIPALDKDVVNQIASLARDKGIPIASHDDDTEEKLAYVQQQLAVGISEFPIGLDVARKAKERGMLTVAGAPNVLLGGSHTGNLSATEAILDGCCDILCSDYFPPSMIHAVFQLHREHGLDLAKAITLVTLNPAKALGVDNQFGTVDVGKKADLLVVEQEDGIPLITRVFIEGQQVSSLDYRKATTYA